MTERSSPSVLSRLLFLWIIPLVRRSSSEHIDENCLPPLPSRLSIDKDFARLTKAVGRFKTDSRTPLIRPVLSAFRGSILLCVLLSAITLCASLMSPLLLREMLRGLSGEASPLWFTSALSRWFLEAPRYAYPLACAGAMGLNSLIAIFSVHHLFFVQPIMAFRLRNALNHLIFTKALRQERASHQNLSSGFIVNLVGTDTQKIATFAGFAHSIYYHPVSIVIVIAILYRLVGEPALIGSASLILFLLASLAISRVQSRLRKQLASIADSRVQLTRETLLHIKAAKLQGWENNLSSKIQAFREQEAALGRRLARLSAVLSFISSTAPAIAMAITSIRIYETSGSLEATVLFPMLSLFMMLRFSINNLPEMLFNLVEASVSLRRIREFLDTPEYHPPEVQKNLPCALVCENLKVLWSDGTPACIVPELRLARGELVVVVGSVGSGKSALLLSILGELTPSEGTISVGGTLGYVAQNPWIVSDSIRNNILAGKPYDESRYRRAVRASGLTLDINSFPHKDNTQIGERGINLSGGQRHRVALARTFYSGADIYLFDDPLSALDPNVANHVFTQLICNSLSTSTRIVVTHRVEYALAADRILVVEGGRIIEQGSPQELRRAGSRFSELLTFHEITNKEVAQAVNASSTPALELDAIDEEDTDEQGSSAIIVAEERQRGAVARSIAMEYVARMASPSVLAVIAALFIGRQLAATSTDLWLARSAQTPNLNPIIFIGGYVCCIVVLCILAYSRSIFMLSCGLAASVRSHARLLHGVLHAPMRFFESHPVGRILNRFSRDLDTVENFLPRNLFDATHCLCETITVCIVIAVTAPVTLTVIIPVAILYYRLYLRYRPAARELQRLSSVTLSPIFAIFSESLSGLETLRVSRLSRNFTERFSKALDVQLKVLFAQTATNRWLGVRLETLGTVVLVSVGVVMALGWDLMVGVGFSGLVLSYANGMMGSMNWAIRSLSMSESSLTSFERMERYAQTEPEATGGAEPPRDWPHEGQITLSQLSVRYRPELPLTLQNISCSIPAGSRVGIVGRTGSGKSTLILACMRLLEADQGQIRIDGIDIATLSLSKLRESIAVVPQEPVLFSGTLRESLDPFGQFSDAQILSALSHVELSKTVDSLPEGLSTRVREGGFNFSSGQRQLICLARALLRKSKVIILDEATAAIDVETDHAIQRAIREEFKGSTILVIAHRLGTILDSDRILALRQGELAEFGTPSELLQQPGSVLGQFMCEAQNTIGGAQSANEG